MAHGNKNLIICSAFEEGLSNYLEKTLDAAKQKAMAEHALGCALCHSLLNDVKKSLAACRELAEPRLPLTRLEARILERTMPEHAISCAEFEDYLTDYLDGFLPAQVFHRWERHAAVCENCTDLPGTVVRSLAALVAYKLEELPLPEGLNEKILQLTSAAERAQAKKASLATRISEWIRGIRVPLPLPQLAPVAMMLLFAFLFVSQTVSADGSLSDVYNKSFLLAEQTYRQGSEVWKGRTVEPQRKTEPVNGTTYVEGTK